MRNNGHNPDQILSDLVVQLVRKKSQMFELDVDANNVSRYRAYKEIEKKILQLGAEYRSAFKGKRINAEFNSRFELLEKEICEL